MDSKPRRHRDRRPRGTMKFGLFIFAASFVVQLGVFAQTIDVDFNADLCRSNFCSFERDKFINLHYNIFHNDMDDDEVDRLMGEMGTGMGRNLQGPLSMVPDVDSQPTYEEAKQMGAQQIQKWKSMESRSIYDSRFKIVGDQAKAFEVGRNDVDTFVKHATWFFDTHFDDDQGVMTPNYYEVANEIFIKWYEYGEDERSTIHEMADFIGDVCCGLKTSLGDKVKCGGPAAAYPRYQRRDFGMWEWRVRDFFLRAGNCVDFMSQHFYDVEGAFFDAILDSINSFTMSTHGKVFPQIISEFGAYSKKWYTRGVGAEPPTPSRDWRIIHKTTALMMQMMTRPHHITKAVAFITGKATWVKGDNPYPWTLLRKDENGEWQWSHLLDIFKTLKDVVGDYRRVDCDDPNIIVNAMVDGNTGYLLIKNLVNEEKLINLRHIHGMPPSQAPLEFKRLQLIESELTDEDKEQELTRTGVPHVAEEKYPSDTSEFLLFGEELVVIKYTFDLDPMPLRRVSVNEYYSGNTVEYFEKGNTLSYEFTGIPSGAGSAFLRLSISRRNGRTIQAKVIFNGQEIDYTAKSAISYDDTWHPFWAVVRIPILRDEVRWSNNVEISFPDGLPGYVSSAILEVQTVETLQMAPLELPSIDLGGLLSGGPGLLDDTPVIENGGFENKMDGWNQEGGPVWPAKAVKNVRTGVFSMGLKPGSAISQVLVTKPYTDYVLIAYGKVNHDGGLLQVELEQDGQLVKIVDIVSTVFSEARIIFNSGPGENKLILRASKAESGFFDDIEILELPSTNAIEFSSPVLVSLPQTGPITIPIDYTVVEDLDIAVVLKDASGGWIAAEQVTIPKGTATKGITIIPKKQLANMNHKVTVTLRTVGGNFKNVITAADGSQLKLDIVLPVA